MNPVDGLGMAGRLMSIAVHFMINFIGILIL